MKITHDAAAGTLESGDAMVRVAPAERLEVSVTSSVETQYGDAIRQVVGQALAQLGLDRGIVTVVDKGALDCVLRARVQGAVARGTEEPVDWAALVGSSR